MLASEFVSKALALTGYKLDSIIELSGGLEVDWLEFKAAIKAQNPEEAASSNDADFIFNLIKAFVSMANGSGGVVVLGIGDDGVAVGLEKSGFDGDKDRFTREFSDKVLLREGWRTQNSGRWYWKNAAEQLEFSPQWAKYQDKDVLAFIIAPRERALGPLVLTKTEVKKNGSQEQDVVFVRTRGDQGKIVRLPVSDAKTWWASRDISVSGAKFFEWIKVLQKTDPAVYRATVSAYSAILVQDTAEDELLYIPLESDVRIHDNKTSQSRYRRDEEYLTSDDSHPTRWRAEVQEILTNVFPAFLIGEPGAGKSATLRRFVREISIANSTGGDTWALYVQLASYTSSGLKALICNEVPSLNWIDIQLGLESGKLTLVLDGLNECPAFHYNQCASEISDLFKGNRSINPI